MSKEHDKASIHKEKWIKVKFQSRVHKPLTWTLGVTLGRGRFASARLIACSTCHAEDRHDTANTRSVTATGTLKAILLMKRNMMAKNWSCTIKIHGIYNARKKKQDIVRKQTWEIKKNKKRTMN